MICSGFVWFGGEEVEDDIDWCRWKYEVGGFSVGGGDNMFSKI